MHKISFPPYNTDIESDEDRSLFGRIVFGVLFILIVVTTAIILVKNIKKKESPSKIREAGKENDKAKNGLLSQHSILHAKGKNLPIQFCFLEDFRLLTNMEMILPENLHRC